MPFKSRAQQGLMHSKSSPLSPGQVKEWDSKTNFSSLPDKIGKKKRGRRPATAGMMKGMGSCPSC